MELTEAERIAIRVKHYDGVPCWCDQCTQRRLTAMRACCPNTLPGAVCVDPDCAHCSVPAQD